MTMWTSDARQRAESVYAAGAARADGLGQGSGALELGLWGPSHSISHSNHVISRSMCN